MLERAYLPSTRRGNCRLSSVFILWIWSADVIVNLCPEMPYAPDAFRSGAVVAFNVQDHTPPTMAQFVEFLNHASASTARGRLLAAQDDRLPVHVFGGEGWLDAEVAALREHVESNGTSKWGLCAKRVSAAATNHEIIPPSEMPVVPIRAGSIEPLKSPKLGCPSRAASTREASYAES